jgi:hypothetical protein
VPQPAFPIRSIPVDERRLGVAERAVEAA